MKHIFGYIVITTIIVIAASVSIYMNNARSMMDELMNANIDALSETEIIVGNLCMQCSDRLCYSLGEPFYDHVRP